MKHTIDNQIISDEEIKRLYQFNIYGRWIIVFVLCLLLLPWGIWQFRETISLCQDQCTWAAIRTGLEFNFFAAVAISFCIGLLTAILVKQSIYILRGGLSDKQKYYLAKKVQKIRNQGEQHWLYQWMYGANISKR